MSLPNCITILRIFSVPFFVTELLSYKPGLEHHRWIALAIFTAAALSDALDGFIARVTNTQTDLGKLIDPLADKLLLLSGYLGLLFVQLPHTPPLWITVTIVFRDIFVLGGVFTLFAVTGRKIIHPDIFGKLTTASQMLTLIVILAGWRYSFIFWNITAVLTILSCLSYIRRDLRKLGDSK